MKSGPRPVGLSTTAAYWEWGETILPHISAAAVTVSSEESGQGIRLMERGTARDACLVAKASKGRTDHSFLVFCLSFPALFMNIPCTECSSAARADQKKRHGAHLGATKA